MSAVPFDTLAAAEDMERAGFDRAKAKAIAGAIRAGQGDLVTQADLRVAIAELRVEMSANTNKLVYSQIAVVGAGVGLMLAVLKLL